MKGPYTKMAIGLYSNYFLLGMINIILASNMSFLTKQLHTDKAGISFLVSAIGIGKLIMMIFSGRISDKCGRKPLVVTSSFLYLIFLIGIPLAPNYQIAFIFAIIAGICNSLMDSGTYPALIEGYPKSAGSATVLVKAFVSIGAAILPFIIAFLIAHDMFYGYSFFLLAAIYLINAIILISATFPNHKVSNNEEINNKGENRFLSKPKFCREGLAIILIGFTSTALFMVVQVWIPTYGQEVLGMSEVSAIRLLSYYSVGALISVLILAVSLNKFVKPLTVMLVYPCVAFISLLGLMYFHLPVITLISAFLFGLSTAGVFQLAMTIMTELFPENKGTTTSYVSLASSSSFILIPFVTGLLKKHFGVTSIFVFDLGIAIVSILLTAYVMKRYKKVIKSI